MIEPTTPTAPSASDTTWTTAYNADGEPSAVTEPGGVSLSYGYDPLGDITSESGSGATATTPARTFGYDLDQRLTSATSGTGTDSFTYNGDSDLTAASGPSGTSSYTYNGDGLVASETGAAGKTSYTYDGADRLSTEAEPLTGATLTWGYNADSNPTSISYATSGTAGPTQSFGYNSLQQVTSDTLTSASGSTLASESYGYDADGNVTSQATGGLLGASSATYGYDKADRLTSAASGGETTDYGYDNDGNLTSDGSATNTYNAQDQLTSSASSAGTTDYSYTLNGEQASVTPPGGSATNDTWDAYGDLASAGSVSYGYDALGRLTSRTAGSGSAASLSYLGTSDTLASDGTSDYSYTPSGAVTGVQQSGGTAYTTMTDQHGDVIGTFSPTSTAQGLAGYSSYSPYGAKTSANYTESLGYQGDYTDPTTGLVYMNARWYNPATGTFTSTDTLGGTPIPASVDGNPYAYADDNPLTETDPSGHLCCGLGTIERGLQTAERWAGSEADPLVEYGGDALEGLGTASTFAAEAAVGGLTALFTLADWAFDPTPTASGCWVDVICAGGGGSPAPTWSPVIPQGGRAGGPGPGGSSGSAGPGGSVGSGYWQYPVSYSPPPPPPPPQDCYAGPDPTCTVPTAPGSLLRTPVITAHVNNITSYSELCQLGDCIGEKVTSKQRAVKGLTTGGNDNSPANANNADQNDQQLLQPIRDQGVQPTPAAEGAGAGGGGGGGPPAPAASSASCGPQPDDGTPLVPDPSALLSLPGNNQNQGPTSGGQSFSGNTQVLLPGGKTAPISSLKPGDKVVATDTKTGKNQIETVTAVEVHHDTNLYDLTVKTSHGTAVIRTTASHLFWDPAKHAWVKAAALRKGEPLRTPGGATAYADGGSTPKIHDGLMWDLTVPGNNDHDFYVAVDASAILVHNINCPSWMSQETANAIRNASNRNVANKIIGNAGRDAVAARYPGSQTEVQFETALGKRIVDVLTPEGVAIESKVGYVVYDSGIQLQVAKDQLLLQNQQVSAVKWLFLDPMYGRSGPSGPLIAALEEAGIQWGIGP